MHKADKDDPIDKAPEPGRTDAAECRIDEQEVESFPASDPHSDWAGPAT